MNLKTAHFKRVTGKDMESIQARSKSIRDETVV